MTMTDKVTPEELRFERLLDAPVEKVWQYLVDSELRARWFMAGQSDLRVGGHLGLTMDHDNLSDQPVPTPEKYRPYVGHAWTEKILRFEPPHVLAIEWENGEAGTVTFTLADEGGSTRLTLVHAGLRGPDDARNFGGGWHSHLAVLERRVRGEAVADFWALHAQAEARIAAELRA
jgi:uncharacterized protein YndB with AHSA1/START domain